MSGVQKKYIKELEKSIDNFIEKNNKLSNELAESKRKHCPKLRFKILKHSDSFYGRHPVTIEEIPTCLAKGRISELEYENRELKTTIAKLTKKPGRPKKK
jgi:hypothetical protein